MEQTTSKAACPTKRSSFIKFVVDFLHGIFFIRVVSQSFRSSEWKCLLLLVTHEYARRCRQARLMEWTWLRRDKKDVAFVAFYQLTIWKMTQDNQFDLMEMAVFLL